VADDACTEMSQKMHEDALFVFRYAFGRVQSTAEILHLCTAPAPMTA
jgi:hypothetical protein